MRNRRASRPGITIRLRKERKDPATKAELSGHAPVPRVAPNGVEFLQVPDWEKAPARKRGWLLHGFSTRRGGVSRAYCPEGAPGELNLGLTKEDDREVTMQNRRLLAEAITGRPDFPIVTLRQFHSNVVVVASRSDADRQSPRKADGLMTAEPGFLLAIQTADCIPVLVADRKRRAVAAFHAGWRGTVKRIVECGIGRMRVEFGSRPEDLIAAIGPGIGACCYSVGEEVAPASSRNLYMLTLSFAMCPTQIQSGRGIPCCFSRSARRATLQLVPACTWIWLRPTGGSSWMRV